MPGRYTTAAPSSWRHPVEGLLGNNHQAADAEIIVLDASNRSELEPVLCPGQSDFFRYETGCPGYFGVEVVVAEDLDDVTLTLSDGESNELERSEGPGETVAGAYRTEVVHYIVPGVESLVIEVIHASGDEVPYFLTTYFLPTGSCEVPEWTCEAKGSLVATETSCSSEPDEGVCPGGAVTTNSVPLPTVGTGGSAFDGWLVATPSDAVVYHSRPSTAELSAILDLCEDACEAQWADNPDVSANCGAGFETPTIWAKPSHQALAAIPSAMQDGSGLFMGDSLSCNLVSDCCDTAFDESLCIATPTRVTPAAFPLGLGEEFVMEIDPYNSTLDGDADGAMSADSVPVEGEVGFSRCTDLSASGACPFYLGHLTLVADGDLEVEVDCPDETTETLTVENLQVSLAQPAFGIDDYGSEQKAFPPGALVFEGSFDSGSKSYDVRGANTEPVYLEADESSLGATGITIEATAPCGSGTTVATGVFEIETDLVGGPIDVPPSITITTPASVTCNSAVTLTATASDTDGDLDEVRWYVDDVLIAPTTTQIRITETHELRAVATDDRGAATTDTKSITCT